MKHPRGPRPRAASEVRAVSARPAGKGYIHVHIQGLILCLQYFQCRFASRTAVPYGYGRKPN